MQDAVELLGRGKVPPERLLDNDPGGVGEPDGRQALHYRREHRRRDRQIEHAVSGPERT